MESGFRHHFMSADTSCSTFWPDWLIYHDTVNDVGKTHTHIDVCMCICVCVSVCMCVPKQCILLVGPLWGLDLLCFSHVVTFPICLSIQPESRLVPWEPPFTPRSLPYRNKGQSLALKVISHVDKNSNFLRRGCSVAANHVEYWQYIPEALALFTDRTVH